MMIFKIEKNTNKIHTHQDSTVTITSLTDSAYNTEAAKLILCFYHKVEGKKINIYFTFIMLAFG